VFAKLVGEFLDITVGALSMDHPLLTDLAAGRKKSRHYAIAEYKNVQLTVFGDTAIVTGGLKG
jgi:hypothetical protein